MNGINNSNSSQFAKHINSCFLSSDVNECRILLHNRRLWNVFNMLAYDYIHFPRYDGIITDKKIELWISNLGLIILRIFAPAD